MTIQHEVGPVNLDAGDFQHTHAGVTWGLKVRYVIVLDGARSLDVLIAEKVNGVWAWKASVAQDDENALTNMGLAVFLRQQIIPRVNTWLKARFSGVVAPPPAVVVPPTVAALDAALFALRVEVVDGVPQIIADEEFKKV
jgi:hypothetical protein